MLNMIALSTVAVSQTLAAVLAFKDTLLVGGVLLLVVWSMMRLRSKKRHSRPIASAGELIERNRQLRGMQGQLQELMVEVEAMARRFGVQLDAKARRLENLLSQADDRIAQLRKLQPPEPQEPQAPPEAPEPQAAPGATLKPTPPQEPITEDPLALSVYQLADSGMQAHAIAMELDEHVGKVELILALRKVK